MNKKIIFILLFVFFSLYFSAGEIVFNKGEKDYSVERLSGYYRIKINKLDYSENKDYVSLKGNSFTNSVGMPKLPAVRFTVYSTDGLLSVKNISLNNRQSVKLSGRVYPVQKSVSKQQNNFNFEINEEFYNSGKIYPERPFEIINAGREGNMYVSIIELFPYSYSSKDNELIVYSDISFEIVGGISEFSNDWDDVPSKYLIVTKSFLINSIAEFIDFKTKQGFYTEILDIDTVGTLNTDIKDAIQSVYDTSSVPLKFILLAGDVNIIPNFIGTEENAPNTDLYYSLLSGSDFIPDVYIGRFPSSDTAYLKIMADKTVMYEKSEWLSGDSWVNNGYLMASDDPSFHLLAESTQIYAAQKMRSVGMSVDSLFYSYNSGTDVASAINSGKSIVAYSGHGSRTSWQGPVFSQANINALLNQDMLPFVSSYACLTGDYAYSSDCFGETWVKAEDKGAVSYMGSSVYSYWDEDDYMERSFFDALADSGIFFIGKLMNKAKMGVYSAYSGEGYSKRYYEMYNILGDPSLALFTQIKDTLQLNVLNLIPESSNYIDVHVSEESSSTPVANALVSLLFHGKPNQVGYTDSIGNITFNNPGSNGDSLYFMASKPNYRYDELVSQVVSSGFYPHLIESSFMDTVFTINLPDSQFSPFDTGAFNIFIENLGKETLFSLQCSLYTTKSYLNFVSPIIYFPDTILLSDSVWGLDAITAFVDSGIKNNTRDTIVFIFKDANDSVSTVKKQVKIKSPEINVFNADYTDKKTGISSLDTVKIVLSIANLSSIDDKSARFNLSPDDSNMIEFLDSSFAFALIPGEETLYSDTLRFFVKSISDTFAESGFKIVYSDTFKISDSFSFTFSINKKDYLVLDYSKDKVSGMLIDSLLGELGYFGDYLYTVSKSNLKNYKNIFLTDGYYLNNSIINSSDSIPKAIDSLCNAGLLNFYLEGGEVWYWDVKYSGGYDFANLFKIKGRIDGIPDSTLLFNGNSSTISYDMNLPYSGGLYLDVIDTLYGAKRLFSIGSDVYAVSYEDENYRTVGSSFDIGSIDDVDSVSCKKEWVKRIMLFFEKTIGIEELVSLTRLPEFGFVSMKSNLVSNELSLMYSALAGEDVNISIFNSLGRVVFNDKISVKSSGINRIVWRGFDNSERKLANGVYFIRIDNSKDSFTKKIMLIR